MCALLLGRASSDATPDGVPAAEDGETAPSEFRWVHIARHSFAPWHSIFQTVRPLAELDLAKLSSLDSVSVEVSASFAPQLRYFSGLDLRLDWSVIWYEVVWEQRMLGSFLPNQLRLRAWNGACVEVSFWGTRARASCVDAWERTLAEASDDDCGDDEDNRSAASSDEAVHESDVDAEAELEDRRPAMGIARDVGALILLKIQ